ncbi:MAG TPA: sigma-54 dependent transcriptional regulator, partial [Thermodesulfobacteriota bacterium]|nr:sigma-54 dependent transcriptional regulator [Thermodesulfobacteriota bacterium]
MKKAVNKASILVLDDEKRQQDILSLILKDAGYDVAATGSPTEALQKVEEIGFDLILTDLSMPGMDGIQFLERVKSSRPQQIILVITGHGTIQSAVTAMKKGAFHYLTKPIQKDELLLFVERALEQGRLIEDNSLLRLQLRQDYSVENMIGKHGRMQEVFRLIHKVAPGHTTVLIYGESGSGKELVAKAIHQSSPRSSLPMRAINCAAIPEALLESELFGYERGAFTGAYARKKGLLEEASGSTLFLDEIGDLGLALQGKILRVLQEQEIQRLGGKDTIQVDVRIISATHRALDKMAAEGAFRDDLYYRLNTFPIVIPPLRERATDISLFVEHFLQKFRNLGNGKVKRVSPVAMDRLLSYQWPGNVRQLESAIERAVILADGEVIEEHHLPPEILNPFSGSNPYAGIDLPGTGLNLEELEKHLLMRAMEKSGGVIAKAARLLGLTYRTLQYRLD